MSSLVLILSAILVIFMVVGAVVTIHARDLLVAIIASAIVDLVLAVLFYILQAPDVAITQASIMGGLTTAIFLVVIKKTERYEQ